MSGVIAVIFAFLAGYFDFVAKRNIAFLWIAAFLGISIAAYRVWAKERRALIGEQAKNAKAEISGQVKEVFFEKHHEGGLASALTQTSEGEIHYTLHYNYVFNVRIYVANHRAATTIERFEVRLRSNDDTHKSTKLPIERDQYAIKRPTGNESMADIEDSNDIPLEHTRNGWLRFSVPGVKGIGDYHKEPNQEIEVSVIDKNGISHPIAPLAQSAWKRSLRESPERVLQLYTKY